MSTAQDLQSAINAFANDPNIGFNPINCDGDIGPTTFQAAMYALTSVSLAMTNEGARSEQIPAATAAATLIDQISSPSDLAARTDDVTAVLNAGASSMGFAAVPCPAAPLVTTPPKSAVTAAITSPAPPLAARNPANVPPAVQSKVNASASLFGLGLPSAVVYGGAGALLLGLIYLIVKRKRAA